MMGFASSIILSGYVGLWLLEGLVYYMQDLFLTRVGFKSRLLGTKIKIRDAV